ncbi:regulatory subunit of cyclin-dependent kinase [Umbelopsis sp. PMI_123]|nr:regulatory subunit of cyclin-dependent kinase [Umbelopsis sp. PMI_123]
MAESTHHKISSNNDDHPPRAHVERTRDIFKATKAPMIKQQTTEPETKAVKSRRAPQEQKEKRERKQAIEKENKLEDKLSEEEQRAKDIAEHEERITYSNYYYDDEYEYRHVTLPKEIAQWIPHSGILADEEWRSLGVKQSIGWEHYMVHAPEPHVLLFKRLKDYQKKFHNKKSQESSSKSKSHDRQHEVIENQSNVKRPRAH